MTVEADKKSSFQKEVHSFSPNFIETALRTFPVEKLTPLYFYAALTPLENPSDISEPLIFNWHLEGDNHPGYFAFHDGRFLNDDKGRVYKTARDQSLVKTLLEGKFPKITFQCEANWRPANLDAYRKFLHELERASGRYAVDKASLYLDYSSEFPAEPYNVVKFEKSSDCVWVDARGGFRAEDSQTLDAWLAGLVKIQ